MAVTVLTGTAVQAESASTTSLACNVPSGVVAGDLLVAVVGATSAVPATVTGWTTATTAGANAAAGLYYRVATGSEPASYTFAVNGSTAGRATAQMVRVTGVDTTTPLDVAAASTGFNAASFNAPTVTTATAGALLLYVAVIDAASAADITAATGVTQILKSTGTGRRTGSYYEVQASAGASTQRTFTESGTTVGGNVITAALRPAVSVTSVSGTGNALSLPLTPGAGTGTGSSGTVPQTGRNAYLQPFASNSVWNTALGSGAVFESVTDAKTASLQKAGMYPYVNAATYSIPITVAAATDPVATVTTPWNGSFTHHMPPSATIDSGTDGNLDVFDGQFCYDYWQAVKQSNTAYTAQAGAKIDLLGSGVGAGIRAGGFPSIVGLIRKEEFAALSIPHVLDLALDPTQLKRGWVWPASSEDAGNSYSGAVPIGTLVGIPPGVDLTGLGLTAEGLMLARALQDYGAYVSDQAGGGPILYAEPSMAGTQALSNLSNDWTSKVCRLLRVVTNSSPTTVGGGGTPRQPTAAAAYIPGAPTSPAATATGTGATLTLPLTISAGTGTNIVPVLNHRVVGIPTGTSATVSVRATNAASVRVKVGTDAAVTAGVVWGTPVTPDAQGYAQLPVTGLTPGVKYYYRIALSTGSAEILDTVGTVGTFRTAPAGPASFAFCFGSCTDAADSGALAAIAARGDDLFFHLGDLYYADGTTATTANVRSLMQAKVEAANHAAVFATTPTAYTPSDHDGLNNDTTAGDDPTAWTAWNAAYRQVFPVVGQVPATTGAYFTFTWGRVRFIQLDDRSYKSATTQPDGATHTALGSVQKQWLKDTITAATEPMIVLLQSGPWIAPAVSSGSGIDSWAGYATERAELGAFFAASSKKIVMLAGDMHALAADNGSNAVGGITVLQAAPFHNVASYKGGPYSGGYYPTTASTVEQYGRCVITDNGAQVSLAFTGYSADNTPRLSLTTVSAFAGVGAADTIPLPIWPGSGDGFAAIGAILTYTGTGAALALPLTPGTGVRDGGTPTPIPDPGGDTGGGGTTDPTPPQPVPDAAHTVATFLTPVQNIYFRIEGGLTAVQPYGKTTWRTNGVWRTALSPSADDLAGADYLFRGGTETPLSAQQRDDLIADPALAVYLTLKETT